MSSVRKNFFYNAAYQLVRILAPLITVPYLSRVLGPDAVGVYSYTYSITSYFVMFAMLGMGTYGVRAIATAGTDRTRRSRVFWSAYAAQLSVSAVVLVAYAAYSLSVAQVSAFLCFLWGFWVLSAAFDVTWLMFGAEDFKAPTIRSMLVKVVEIAFVFLLVHSPSDLWVYVAIVVAGFVVSQLVLWPFVPRYVDFARPTWREVRAHYLPCLRLFIPIIAYSIYTTFDKVLLGGLSTMEQTGFFEYSDKIAKVPLALITALVAVMMPRMSAVFSSGDEEGGKELVEASMWFVQGGALAMAFGVAAIAPELAPVFLGEAFSACAPLMIVLAIAVPLIAASNVLGRQYLIPRFRDAEYTVTIVCGAVASVSTVLALVPSLGAMGAAVAAVAAEVAVLLAQAWVVRRELPLARYVRNAVPFVACGAFMMLTVRIAASAFVALWGPSVAGLVLEIAVGALVYIALACAWCIFTRNRHFMRMVAGFGRAR